MTHEKTKATVSGINLNRPHWLCHNVKQVAILCRDRSPSMSGAKAEDASAASCELVEELAQPVNKDGFYVGIVDFAVSAQVIHTLEKATALNKNLSPLQVVNTDAEAGTNITAALENALQLLKKPPKLAPSEANDQFLRPVIILLSDGCHNRKPHPRAVAEKIKKQADLVTVAFGNDADETLLAELATTPQHLYRCQDGRQLRSFLAAVGATMTATMAAGTAATTALTAVKT